MLDERARLVDILAVLSLTTDLATGFPFERGLRACLVADGLAQALELDPPDHRAAFLASLVRAVGCGHASENAALFGDDIVFERFLVTFDPGDEAVAGAQLAGFETVVGAAAMQKFLEVAPSVGPVAVRASCEVAVALGTQLGLPAVVVESFGDVFERWDGRGLPSGRAGEALHPPARIVGVAEQAAIAHALGGVAVARSEIARRAGGHLDPSLCEVFLANTDEILAPIDEADDLGADNSSYGRSPNRPAARYRPARASTGKRREGREMAVADDVSDGVPDVRGGAEEGDVQAHGCRPCSSSPSALSALVKSAAPQRPLTRLRTRQRVPADGRDLL